MKVRFAERAEAQLDERHAWWRAHRDERDLFNEELDAAVRFLAVNATTMPVVRKTGGRSFRRVLMPRTACHLYFEVIDEEVFVVAAWGATRGRLPRLT